MYRSTSNKTQPKNVVCDDCGSKMMRYERGAIICTNCDKVIYKPTARKNKFNAVKTVSKDGLKKDSKFEASVADELYMRKSAGDILDYESQYKVELLIYNREGLVVMKKNWKRDLLLNVWLPDHPDHEFEVRTMGNRAKSAKKW